MAYGYNNRYRSAGGYRPSSRNYVKRRRNYKRIRNRAIIITSGLIVCVIAVALIVGAVKLVTHIASSFNGSINTASVVEETATKSPSAASSDKKTESKTKSAAKPKVNKAAEFKYVTPKIADDGTSTGEYDSNNGLYIYKKMAFELFYGSDAKAKEYAEVVNSAKKSLGGDINVYSMIIPNHTEMGLPARLKNTDKGVNTNSQSDYTQKSYLAMDGSVEPVNVYNNIANHCDEYVYFDSDHHWTGLGAYYAYEAFAKQTKQTPIKLSEMKENTIKGFTGSFTSMTKYPLNVDTVHFWSMPFDVENKITEKSGREVDAETMYYWGEGPGENSYGVFLFGDNPKEVIKSKAKTASDQKIAIIHESYGNALVPYFAANYKEIHSIDFRYFDGNLASYCKEHNIKNVLFANGVMSSATEDMLQSMRSLIG